MLVMNRFANVQHLRHFEKTTSDNKKIVKDWFTVAYISSPTDKLSLYYCCLYLNWLSWRTHYIGAICQKCTNPRKQMAQENEFLAVVRNICGFSVLHPSGRLEFWGGSLDFWKTYVPLFLCVRYVHRTLLQISHRLCICNCWVTINVSYA